MFAIEIIVKNSLYSIKFEEEDEFENNEFEDNSRFDVLRRTFTNWTDPEYLNNFFNKYKKDLERDFYTNISIEKAIEKTIDEAIELEERMIEVAKKGDSDDTENLQTMFKPLNKKDESIYPIPELQKSKAYGISAKSWLRIYAIRIDKNLFIITGSAIKLTKTMNERVHLKNELERMESVKQFLMDENIIDNDSIVEFFEI